MRQWGLYGTSDSFSYNPFISIRGRVFGIGRMVFSSPQKTFLKMLFGGHVSLAVEKFVRFVIGRNIEIDR